MKKILTFVMIALIFHVSMAQENIVPKIESCDPVKNLQVNNGETCVVYLTWEKPVNSNVSVSYEIYYNGLKIGNTTELSYDYTVTESGYNSFCVMAVYATCESEWICREVYTPCVLPCPAVSNLTAQQQSNTVLLEWMAAEEGTPILYAVYNGMNQVATVANTEYIFEGLAPGEYIFGVEALFEYYCIPVMVNINFIVGEIGIDEVELSDLIFIYPNPTSEEFKVSSLKLRIENIEIIDIYGQKLSSLFSRSSPLTSINISHLPAGIYFVRITTEKEIITKKIVKK